MPTMKDIAREAGVSHGTVSNVLNKTGKVSIEKIRLVEEAAKRLGYVPNAQAQLLRQGSPSQIALILPSLREETYLDLYTSVQTSLLASYFQTVVHTTDDISNKEEAILEKLHISNIAAVVTVSSLSSDCVERYNSFPCPVIYVDRKPAELRDEDCFYTFDFSDIGIELGAYILQNRWKNVAFFSSPNAFHQASILLSAIQGELSDAQVSIQEYTSAYNYALNKAFDIIQSGIAFDAIITPSSVRAETITSALQLSRIENKPQIITLGSFRTFHANDISTFELDYNKLGAKLSADLIHHLQNKTTMPKYTTLKAKGFPYRFSTVKQLDKQTITLLILDNPTVKALQKLLPMFESISGVNVKVVCLPYDDLHAQIERLSPEFSYDLVRMDVAKFDSLGEKTYLPLKELGIAKEALPQKLIDSAYNNYCTLNGEMYALPFDPSVQLFLYRKDLFEDALLRRAYYERFHEQLAVPTTIDQYLRVAEFFTKSINPDSPTEFGATVTNGSSATAACDFLPYFLEKSSDICDELGNIIFTSPNLIGAMEQYKKMGEYSTHQQWWNDSIQQFSDGITATTVIFSNYASNIISASQSQVIGKVGAAVVPGGNPLLGGGVIGVSRYSQKLEACRQFINWFYSPDIASLLVRLGGTSPLVDAYNDFRNFSIFPWLSTSKNSFKLGSRGTSDPRAVGFSIQKYEFAIGTAIRSMSSGIMSPKEAATMATALYKHST